MLQAFERKQPHFSPYYENPSLLIQFIIAEFSDAYAIMLEIDTLTTHYLKSPDCNETFLPKAIELMTSLIGILPHESQFALFTRWNKGPLTKLKEYCNQLTRSNTAFKEDAEAIFMTILQTWQAAIASLELLHALKIVFWKEETKSFLNRPLTKSFKTLQTRFARFIKQFPLLLLSFVEDENVLLCLFRRKEAFIQIYGKHFFTKKFKGQITDQQLKELVFQRYQEREYAFLLTHISYLFS